MKREAWKVLVACALGAGIGSLIAIEVATWLWWLGLLVGGAIGYLAYKPIQVIRAIPDAARAAARKTLARYRWMQMVLATPKLGSAMLYSFTASFSIASWFVVLIYLCELADGSSKITAWMYVGLLVFSSSFSLVIFLPAMTGPEREMIVKKMAVDMKELTCWCFPPFTVFYHLPRGIWWLARHGIPRLVLWTAPLLQDLARFAARFVWELFIRIHSEMRLLCMVDATIGVVIGFFAGSALIGALAGGLFGLVNYVIVTERWLKPCGYVPISKE